MTEVEIDDDFADAIARRCDNTKFNSIEEYVNFVLQEVLREGDSEDITSGEEDRNLDDHLEDLGYL